MPTTSQLFAYVVFKQPSRRLGTRLQSDGESRREHDAALGGARVQMTTVCQKTAGFRKERLQNERVVTMKDGRKRESNDIGRAKKRQEKLKAFLFFI